MTQRWTATKNGLMWLWRMGLLGRGCGGGWRWQRIQQKPRSDAELGSGDWELGTGSWELRTGSWELELKPGKARHGRSSCRGFKDPQAGPLPLAPSYRRISTEYIM